MKLNDDIANYYEHLVLEHIAELNINRDDDYIADLCCIVLNQLPARYIRYHVDMAFYLPNHERLEMQMKVSTSVEKAIEFLDKTNRDG